MTQRKKEIAKEREALKLREQAWRDEVLKMEATLVRSRRPAVLRRLHAIDATRLQERSSWVVSFSNLSRFGPLYVYASRGCTCRDGIDQHRPRRSATREAEWNGRSASSCRRTLPLKDGWLDE